MPFELTDSNIEKKSILFFLTSLRGGGAERVMLDLTRAFSSDGFLVSLVILELEGEYRGLIPNSVHVESLNGGLTFFGVIGKFFTFLGLLRRVSPSVIFTTLPGGNIFCFFAWLLVGRKSKLVLREASTPSKILKKYSFLKSIAVPAFIWLAYRFASAVVAPSEGSASDLSRFYGIPRQLISVIPNPVELPVLETIESHPHPYFTGSDPVVLGIGRLDKQKRFSDLIDAVTLLRDHGTQVRLLILGEGPERTALLKKINACRLVGIVDLPGFDPNVLSALKSCDVFALVSEVEGLPNTLLQALACRKPVVSTDCTSGPREILASGQFGALVPVGDVVAIARAIDDAIVKNREVDFDCALAPFSLNRIKMKYKDIFEL